MAIHTLSVLFEFSASHRLFNPALSEQENQRLYGKCANKNGHGHNYGLEVVVSGPINPASQMIFDAGLLKELVERSILADVDHKDLNRDVSWLEGSVPTTEVVAHAIFLRLSREISAASSSARLEEITVRETRRISVTVKREE